MTIHIRQRLMKLLRWIPLLLLCVGIENCSFFRRSTHDDLFTNEGVLVAQSDELRATVVSSHTDIHFERGRNVLWCGSFQLAWNEAFALVGEDLHFVNEHPSVALLNKHILTKESLDEESFVALAGFVQDNIHQKIHDALRQKFHGEASPRYIPSPSLTPRPQDIVAYAYLFKNLAFETPFERLKKPVKFNGTHVSCFGIGEEYKPGHRKMYSQIHIIDYRHPDDFIIELQTTSSGDMVILAKVTPENTLAHMMTTLQHRITLSQPIQAESGDVLKIPRFNFDITRKYAELEEQGVLSIKNPEIAKDLGMLSAVQNIRFQMDEEGIRLRSESHLALGCAAHYEPRPRYMMIFDKPFLLMLQRVNANIPYFVLWVDNPELLIRQ